MRDAWMNDQYTEQVFYSTAQQPHLTTDQTITPEQLEQRAQRARLHTSLGLLLRVLVKPLPSCRHLLRLLWTKLRLFPVQAPQVFTLRLR